ncbi:MAG: twin-arginine translocation signal domain-containing protein [Bacteroidota bacterium]
MARDNQNNRRDFLKTAAKGGLALSLTGIAANALADVVVANDFVCKNAKPFSLSI